MEAQDGGRLAIGWLGEEPVEVVDDLGRDLLEGEGFEALGQLVHETAVAVQGGGGPAEVLDVVEPLLEQRGHRLGCRGDDAGVNLGDEGGELALRFPLAAAEVLVAVLLLPADRVGALEHPELPVAGAALAHRASHR